MKNIHLVLIVLLTGMFSVSSCKKKDEPEPEVTPTSTPTALNINSNYQASFKLDGSTISYVQSNPDFQIVHGSNNSLNTSGGNSTFSYSTFVGVTDTVGLEVEKGTITMVNTWAAPEDTTFYRHFAPATVAYAPSSVGSPNGIVITYWDGTIGWKSNIGAADQTGSTFKIIDRKDVTMSGFEYTVKVYATFNCKLYDGNGNVKTLTNGVLISSFAKI